MKLRKMVLGVTALAILTGCGAKTKVVGGNYVVASVGEKDILADHIYNKMLSSASGDYLLFQYVEEQIINVYFPKTDTMIEAAKLERETIESQYQNYYGTSWKTQLDYALYQNGFNDMDEYEQRYVYILQYNEYISKYIDENFDAVFDDYYDYANPRLVSHILVKIADLDNPTEEETAKLNTVKQKLAAATTMEEWAAIAKEYSDDTGSAINGGNLGLSDDNTEYVEEFLKVSTTIKQGVLSDPVKVDASNYKGYHFIWVTEDKKEVLKADMSIRETLMETLKTYDDYISLMVYQDYDIVINDENLAAALNDYIEDQSKARAELRK